MNRDKDKQKVYDAESDAFLDTPLADLIREEEVVAGYRAVLASPVWQWSPVNIRSGRVDITRCGGYESRDGITTVASRVHRSVISHELSHAVVRRIGAFDPGHGPVFRRVHVYLAGAIFGEEYGDLLLRAYTAHHLSIDLTPMRLPIVSVPVINIDALSIATAPTGGWRRS